MMAAVRLPSSAVSDVSGEGTDRPVGTPVGEIAIEIHGGIGMTMEYQGRPLFQARP